MAEAQNPLDAKVKIVAYIDEMACTNYALKILIGGVAKCVAIHLMIWLVILS